jgi:hypothetical protein
MKAACPNALLVIAKRPAAGQTKTRLTPPLSAAQAAALYECFLKDTLVLMQTACALADAQPIVLYLPAGAQAYFRTLAPQAHLLLQRGDNLGQRLDNAIADCLALGYQRVVVMDSDSPTLPVASLAQAFAVLADGAEACFGPCADGGYYLVGARTPIPHLLREVQMSTDHVLADTLALAKSANTSVGLLAPWHDIDTHAELERLIEELRETHPPQAAAVAAHTRAWLQKECFLSSG